MQYVQDVGMLQVLADIPPFFPPYLPSTSPHLTLPSPAPYTCRPYLRTPRRRAAVSGVLQVTVASRAYELLPHFQGSGRGAPGQPGWHGTRGRRRYSG